MASSFPNAWKTAAYALNELAQHMECCVRTIDRAVRKLRDEGYIEVVVLYGEDGGQICNEYRLAEHRS